ncbi:PREDICTED: stromelysin-1-like [Elephantulus edwardii]|uniref:stromelysin-1-like n=1 Tax=Elephantulus edwardii TaxID=28737 RepID=UPI0003F05FC1|nr:PREDICTED: stromelysin-1-like [Elephantulus edwardii]
MKSIIIFVLLCPSVLLAYTLDKTVRKDSNIDVVQENLENGYNQGKDIKQFVGRNDSSAVVKKIQEMQRSSGLKVMKKRDSGILEETLVPICGRSMVGQFSRLPRTTKWKKTNITYRITNYTSKLSRYSVDSAIEKALKLWKAVTPLTFTRLYDEEADIMISFMRRDHKDFGSSEVDNSSLAHAYLPGRGLGGDIHFYDDIQWTGDYSGKNFLQVAVHEVGHALGLYHSNNPEALMYTFYMKPEKQSMLCLSQDDVKQIQYLYGPPPSCSNKTTMPEESISTKSQPPVKCDPNLSFDAVTTMRGETLFFKTKHFWRLMKRFPEPVLLRISSHWPSLPSRLDAAYEAHAKDTVFIFKADHFWAFKTLELQAGYPRSIYTLGFPQTVKKIDAAFSDKDSGKTYFFVQEKYWRFDEASQSMDQGFPRLTIQDFPGVNRKINAALKNSGFVYFFSGPLQIEFDPNTKKVTKRVRANRWLGC